MLYLEISLVFVFSWVTIQLLKMYASNLSLLDVPNSRSEHKKIVPRAGGLGFVVISLLSLFLFHFELFYHHILSIVAICIVFVVGLLDDRVRLKPKYKFISIGFASFLLYLDGISINTLGVYLGVDIELKYIALPFTLFAVTGFTNAINLIDGLDGLSALISLYILSVFALIGYVNYDDFILYFSLTFLIALSAFLIFNWYPATIFMGDSGSLSLGFIIAMLGIKSLEYYPSTTILFITAIPIFDTIIVMYRRKVSGRSILRADRCHIHHILKRFFKDNVQKTVIVILFLEIFYSIFGMIALEFDDNFLMMSLFLLNIVILYKLLNFIIKKENMEC